MKKEGLNVSMRIGKLFIMGLLWVLHVNASYILGEIMRIILLCGNNYTNSKDIVKPKVEPAYFDIGVSDLVRIMVLIIT